MKILFTLKEGGRFEILEYPRKREWAWAELISRGTVNGMSVNSVIFSDGKTWDKFNGLRPLKFQNSAYRYQQIKKIIELRSNQK